ncbi:helix-turn-helix transcriptional regulator [Actinomadura opuntiae]|uniref:helix-turn-helix transcriptional regulator n=1 Tax=Actinomadura sp. OS1-43 TaxID=604315 RepID=UPI00255AE6BF|nr:winged helix-turn-helix domain-containing protein [Actinomadura sp. OS1-43]MDL4813209.1 winged helix-turn-helix domain-containing protein [Actinomadura sp. OS1-43]
MPSGLVSSAGKTLPGVTSPSKPWTFLTNHARVLICIARDPTVRVRDIAEQVQITERSAQMIVGDLEEAGYLTRTRQGRRNHYALIADRPFRHPADSGHQVLALIALFTQSDGSGRADGQHDGGPRRS